LAYRTFAGRVAQSVSADFVPTSAGGSLKNRLAEPVVDDRSGLREAKGRPQL
jgi:hypothetical protein